jgi:hypothetical protein
MTFNISSISWLVKTLLVFVPKIDWIKANSMAGVPKPGMFSGNGLSICGISGLKLLNMLWRLSPFSYSEKKYYFIWNLKQKTNTFCESKFNDQH